MRARPTEGIISQTQRRRMLIAAGSLLAAPLAWAQTGGRARRVAFVNTTSPLAEYGAT